MRQHRLTTYGVGTTPENRWTGTSLLTITAAVSFANLHRKHMVRGARRPPAAPS